MADKQRREYLIHPDGTVDERVMNVKGPACEKVTRDMEKRLGKVVHREYTPEYAELPEPRRARAPGAAAEARDEQRAN